MDEQPRSGTREEELAVEARSEASGRDMNELAIGTALVTAVWIGA